MGAHSDDTGVHKSLEETILENLDAAALSAEEPAKQAFNTAIVMKRIICFIAVYGVLLGAACTYALYKVADVVNDNQRYLETSCEGANVSRAQEEALLTFILNQSFGPKPKGEAKKLLDSFLVKIDETYPQRDCSAVKEGEVVNVTPSTKP